MKLINTYYQIKYGLNEQIDLDKVTVKNPESGNEVKVTSVLNNPEYKGKPVEKAAKDKVASLTKDAGTTATEKKPETKKSTEPKDNPKQKKEQPAPGPSQPKKPEVKKDDKNKAPSERISDAGSDKNPRQEKMSVADIGKEESKKKVKEYTDKVKEDTYKNIAKDIFGDEKKADDLKKLHEEKDDNKRLEQIKKMNPKLKDEHAKIINDMIGPDEKKAKEAQDQISELFPEEAQDFNAKCEKAGIGDNGGSSLDNADEPGGTTKPKEESKTKKWGKRIGLGLLLTPPALLGLGIFVAGGLTKGVFGLAGKALDTLTAMVQGTMGTNR